MMEGEKKGGKKFSVEIIFLFYSLVPILHETTFIDLSQQKRARACKHTCARTHTFMHFRTTHIHTHARTHARTHTQSLHRHTRGSAHTQTHTQSKKVLSVEFCTLKILRQIIILIKAQKSQIPLPVSFEIPLNRMCRTKGAPLASAPFLRRRTPQV